jgi:hypothetical protein
MPRTVAGENVEWSAEERIYSSTNVPCDDGNQTWAGYYYPGVITQHPTGTEDMSIKGKFKVSCGWQCVKPLAPVLPAVSFSTASRV